MWDVIFWIWQDQGMSFPPSTERPPPLGANSRQPSKLSLDLLQVNIPHLKWIFPSSWSEYSPVEVNIPQLKWIFPAWIEYSPLEVNIPHLKWIFPTLSGYSLLTVSIPYLRWTISPKHIMWQTSSRTKVDSDDMLKKTKKNKEQSLSSRGNSPCPVLVISTWVSTNA